jgi:hypothetical protein
MTPARDWMRAGIVCLLAWAAMSPGRLAAGPTNGPPVKQLGPGLFQIGAVRLNKAEKSASFPGMINLTNVLLEYAVVHSSGKVHESLIRTEVDPYHVHLAMLLLGVNERASQAAQDLRPASRQGEPVSIWVSWQAGAKKVRLEDWIFNRETGKPMARGPWTYNGSSVEDGTFLAQANGSVVAIIEDAGALINNPRPGSENDEIWFPVEKGIPGLDTPVEVTIKLEPKPAPGKPENRPAKERRP